MPLADDGPGTCTATCSRSRAASCSSTPGLGLPDAAERWAAELAQLDAPVVDDLPDALPPRPPRRGCGRPRAHRRTRRARAASTPRRRRLAWENDGWSEVLADWFHRERRPRGGHRGADRPGAAVSGRSSGRSPDPELVDDGDTLHGWEVVAAPGPCGRPADAAQGRRPDRGRPPARPDHADGRALAGEPARPARRLPRGAAADDRARARRSPTAATATPITDPVGRAQRADRAPRRAARAPRRALGPEPAHGLRGVVPALRRRPRPGGAHGSPSPRRSPTSSGSSGTGRAERHETRARRERRRRLLYCRAVVGELPSSTAAPETGA